MERDTKNYYDIIIASDSINDVPSVVKILPIGTVKSQKGTFVVDEKSFSDIKQRFTNRGLDLVVDYEHQTLKDIQAPAGGWIKDIILEPGQYIAAKIEWTEKAQEYLKNKEYKYLSPVVLVNKETHRAFGLHSVALTNTPAIDNMYAIVNSLNLEEENKEMNGELLKTLAKIYGINENEATEEKILEAAKASMKDTELVANKTITDLLEVPENATTSEITAKIIALKSPADVVSKADYLALKEKVDRAEAENAVTEAMKAGKITPAQKDWAFEYALKDSEGFNDFVNKAPAVVNYDQVSTKSDDVKSGKLSEAEAMICKVLAVSEEDINKYGKAEII